MRLKDAPGMVSLNAGSHIKGTVALSSVVAFAADDREAPPRLETA